MVERHELKSNEIQGTINLCNCLKKLYTGTVREELEAIDNTTPSTTRQDTESTLIGRNQ